MRLALALLLLSVAGTAHAQETISIDAYEVDATCPAQETLVASLRDRLQRDPIDPESSRRARIAIGARGTALAANVELTVDGNAASRNIEGETDCIALVDAISLMLAIAIDPSFEERSAEPPVSEPADSPRPRASPRATPPAREDAWPLGLGALVGVTYDTFSESFGVGMGARYFDGPWSIGLVGRVTMVQPDSTVWRRLLTVDALGCLHTFIAPWLETHGCLVFTAGSLAARSTLAMQPATAAVPHLALGAQIGAGVPLWGTFQVTLDLGSAVSLYDTTFTVDGDDAWQTPDTLIRATLGVATRWQ